MRRDLVPAADSAPGSAPAALQDVGVVAIGRNEGERLHRCLDSLPPGVRGVVYVDSASTDDSVAQALRRGIDVLELDMSVPFTAARARNAGVRRLRERWPDIRFVQLVDGDCAVVPGWLDAAVRELESNARIAVVCGRRREIEPDASIYNRLADMEWDTPVGVAESCGGDALVRLGAVVEVGGYDERIISGEEPELCARLRARGWEVRRLDREMTRHDAAISRFGQWWKRARRAGHGYAQVSAVHPALYRREKRSSLRWGLLLPAAALGSAPVTGGAGLLLLAAYPILWARILRHRRARGDAWREAALYAAFCVLAKLPELAGVATYWWNRSRGVQTRLIEYK
jgi:GT2 family glycosyltransferase